MMSLLGDRMLAKELLRVCDEFQVIARICLAVIVTRKNYQQTCCGHRRFDFLDQLTLIQRLYFSIVLLAASSLSLAEADIVKSRELAQVRMKIREASADARVLIGEKNAQIEQLKKLEKQYGDQVNVLSEIKSDIKQRELGLQNLRSRMVAMQKELQNHQDGLQGLIKSAYAMGDRDGLKMSLNQRDPAEFGRIKVYYDYISKARVQKLQVIDQDLKVVRQMEAQNDTETQLLKVALEKKQQEADALQALKSQRENLLAQIDNDYALKQGELAKLIHDEKKLETLVASLQNTDDNGSQSAGGRQADAKNDHIQEVVPVQAPDTKAREVLKPVRPIRAFAELQGHLPWPVQGAITDRFGSRRFETTWDGAVISAREGASVHAIADGRVVYADWLRGYGLMIIVDHGRGYMSLYAFNQSLHKSVGESVSAGEALASVGRSGGRAQAALYFGIRNKGRPVDPEKWCRKPEKG